MCPVYTYSSHHDRHVGLTTIEPQWLSAREELIYKALGLLTRPQYDPSFVVTSFPNSSRCIPLSGIRWYVHRIGGLSCHWCWGNGEDQANLSWQVESVCPEHILQPCPHAQHWVSLWSGPWALIEDVMVTHMTTAHYTKSYNNVCKFWQCI